MKTFEIWIGFYNGDMGAESYRSEQIGQEVGRDFKTACYKFKLKRELAWIEKSENDNRGQVLRYYFAYNPETMKDAWQGQLFPSKEEADKSFRRLYFYIVIDKEGKPYGGGRVDNDNPGPYTFCQILYIQNLMKLIPPNDGATLSQYKEIIVNKMEEDFRNDPKLEWSAITEMEQQNRSQNPARSVATDDAKNS